VTAEEVASNRGFFRYSIDDLIDLFSPVRKTAYSDNWRTRVVLLGGDKSLNALIEKRSHMAE
jgi:hypothetical protein